MPRDVRVFLEDIVTACERIDAYTRDLTFDSFSADPRTVDAVVRNLEVIGEAVKSVPPEVRQQMPDIEWQRIAGLRDILIHNYFGVDLVLVWDVVETKVPALQKRVREFLAV